MQSSLSSPVLSPQHKLARHGACHHQRAAAARTACGDMLLPPWRQAAARRHFFRIGLALCLRAAADWAGNRQERPPECGFGAWRRRRTASGGGRGQRPWPAPCACAGGWRCRSGADPRWRWGTARRSGRLCHAALRLEGLRLQASCRRRRLLAAGRGRHPMWDRMHPTWPAGSAPGLRFTSRLMIARARGGGGAGAGQKGRESACRPDLPRPRAVAPKQRNHHHEPRSDLQALPRLCIQSTSCTCLHVPACVHRRLLCRPAPYPGLARGLLHSRATPCPCTGAATPR